MRFTLEIADDWIDVLDALMEWVAAQDDPSPEAALEKALFAQLEQQRKEAPYAEPATPGSP